jgi:hypothetical protein
MDGKCLEKRVHEGIVTGVKFYGNELFSAGADGTIKEFSLVQMSLKNTFFNVGFAICDFSKNLNSQNMDVITSNGVMQTVNVRRDVSFTQQLPTKHILASCFGEEGYYLLSEDGALYCKETLLLDAASPGWNCLSVSRREIIVGSYLGDLAVLRANEG